MCDATYKYDGGNNQQNKSNNDNLENHQVHDTEHAKHKPPKMRRGLSTGIDWCVFQYMCGQKPTQCYYRGKDRKSKDVWATEEHTRGTYRVNVALGEDKIMPCCPIGRCLLRSERGTWVFLFLLLTTMGAPSVKSCNLIRWVGVRLG